VTKEQVLINLQAGKVLCCVRRDDPLLPWLLEHPCIENSGVIQVDDQSSCIKFRWRGEGQ